MSRSIRVMTWNVCGASASGGSERPRSAASFGVRGPTSAAYKRSGLRAGETWRASWPKSSECTASGSARRSRRNGTPVFRDARPPSAMRSWRAGRSATRSGVLLPPGSSGDASRTAIVATVESPDGRIPLATTQLTSAPWDSATRCAQIRELVDRLAGLEREDYPVLVLGDMNAEPESDEIRLLCGTRPRRHARGSS